MDSQETAWGREGGHSVQWQSSGEWRKWRTVGSRGGLIIEPTIMERKKDCQAPRMETWNKIKQIEKKIEQKIKKWERKKAEDKEGGKLKVS
jgi:hypothetical protein